MVSFKSKHWIPFHSIQLGMSSIKKIKLTQTWSWGKLTRLKKNMSTWLPSFTLNYRQIGRFKDFLKTSDARVLRWGKMFLSVKICYKRKCKPYSKCNWRRSGDFIVNFEHISHLFLVFLLFILNKCY